MPPSQRGTGFTNLQTYLGLNQGAANRMGGALADDSDAAGAKAGADLQADYASQWDAIQSGTPRSDLNPTSYSEAASLAGKGYTGPTSPELDAGRHLNAGANAYNRTIATGDNAGRSTLLREKYGANTYGGGALDAALAGASGAAGRMDSQRSEARGKFDALKQQLGVQQESLGRAVTAAKSNADVAQQGYRDTLNTWERQGMSNTPASEQAPGIQSRRRENVGERTNRGGFGRNYP